MADNVQTNAAAWGGQVFAAANGDANVYFGAGADDDPWFGPGEVFGTGGGASRPSRPGTPGGTAAT
ncbi:hypothetical protein [Kitasatospora cineracea]|uniref:hypothetical protein n=1 Tax=Kitasatospora cineracea TaxID=88074 RepID=UPI0011CDB8C3|nr:hypothetical protein [Kitasatospora cineracea]